MQVAIPAIRHPLYKATLDDWIKWRLTDEGGWQYIHRYLKKFSNREDEIDFRERRELTYIPAFAKAAVTDIKNSIFQRITDVTRSGGPDTYQKCIEGELDGVDLKRSNMNSFIGLKVLPELLTMGKVGVYVDMPHNIGDTIKDKGTKHPYLYTYCAEDILSWEHGIPESPTEFTKILLCDHVWEHDEIAGLPIKQSDRYRLIWIEPTDGKVHLRFYNSDNMQVDPDTSIKTDQDIILNLTRIPFVQFEIPHSLYREIADYQIALLNLESGDINYARKANYPFYTEQYLPQSEATHLKGYNVQETKDGVVRDNTQQPETKIGIAQGRRYPTGTDRPDFIHPSAEPLKVSMEKGNNLKRDIRALVNLAVVEMGLRANASESAKQGDSQPSDSDSLEAGLSFIGLVLEAGEKLISIYWALYETGAPATVAYPTNYSIKTESQRQAEAENLEALKDKVASPTYKKEMCKRLVTVLLKGKISNAKLNIIYEEIDAAATLNSDPTDVINDLQNGLVTVETASIARGYKKGEAELAKDEQAERLALIASAQGFNGASNGAGPSKSPPAKPMNPASGVPDLTTDPTAGKTQKAGKPKRAGGAK